MYGRVMTRVEYRRAVELAPDNYIVLSNLAGASPPLLSRLLSSPARLLSSPTSSHLPPGSSHLPPAHLPHPCTHLPHACAQLGRGWTEVLQPPRTEAVGRRRCIVLAPRLGSLLTAPLQSIP